MLRKREFIRTFLSVSFVLWAFAGVFIYFLYSPADKSIRTAGQIETETGESVILIEIAFEKPVFYLIKAGREATVVNLPRELKVRYENKEESLEYFYNYGGGEYALQALSSVCEIDGYMKFEKTDFYDFTDRAGGLLINLKSDIKTLKAGNQIISGAEITELNEYIEGLSYDGQINIRTKTAVQAVNNIVLKQYGMSTDGLYKLAVKYARTDINLKEFRDIKAKLEGLKEIQAEATGVFVEGSIEDDLFVISDASQSLIQKKYYTE